MSPDTDAEASLPRQIEASRKRAAVELFVRHEATLRRTAGRYSLCADDVDEALQRSLEILLTKAPSEDPRELIRWTQTVVKHEALAVRRDRERILSGPASRVREDGQDWVALLPAREAGPADQVERREAIARSREALQALKPQELRALGLLAEGYSYAEIGEITGFSQTKVNRCLAEGRERFRRLLSQSEDGSRCTELGPQLSAYCDGEASPSEAAAVREHLRACASCRAAMRTYRAAPGAVAALLPVVPDGQSLFERAHHALADVVGRFGPSGGDATASQVAIAGGSRGAGAAALAKLLAICAGTAGGAVACVAGGVVPAPLALDQKEKAPAIEREARGEVLADWSASTEPDPEPVEAPAEATQPAEPNPTGTEPAGEPEPERGLQEATTAPVAETAPEPAPVVAPPVSSAPPPSTARQAGSAAGEFGP